MKSLTLLNIVLSLPGLASAVCNNNCGRQVIGTGRIDPPLASRSSLCAAFVTTYVTVSSGPEPSATASLSIVLDRRNVHGPRQATSAPVITGTKPAYASSCPDATAYWSACQCFDGIKATTITVGGPTVTSGTARASSTTTSTTTRTTTLTISSSVAPTCTPGTEIAVHVLEDGSDLCNYLRQADDLEEDGVQNGQVVQAKDYNLTSLLQGRVPAVTGLVERGPGFWQDDDTTPINYNGVRGPEGSTFRCNMVVHRGYFKVPKSGLYEVMVFDREDVLLAWFGDNPRTEKVRSGKFNARSADVIAQYDDDQWRHSYFIDIRNTAKLIPFRIFFSTARGSGGFQFSISRVWTGSSDGWDIPTATFYSNCSGDAVTAPGWPAWESEDYSGSGVK